MHHGTRGHEWQVTPTCHDLHIGVCDVKQSDGHGEVVCAAAWRVSIEQRHRLPRRVLDPDAVHVDL